MKLCRKGFNMRTLTSFIREMIQKIALYQTKSDPLWEELLKIKEHLQANDKNISSLLLGLNNTINARLLGPAGQPNKFVASLSKLNDRDLKRVLDSIESVLKDKAIEAFHSLAAEIAENLKKLPSNRTWNDHKLPNLIEEAKGHIQSTRANLDKPEEAMKHFEEALSCYRAAEPYLLRNTLTPAVV